MAAAARSTRGQQKIHDKYTERWKQKKCGRWMNERMRMIGWREGRVASKWCPNNDVSSPYSVSCLMSPNPAPSCSRGTSPPRPQAPLAARSAGCSGLTPHSHAGSVAPVLPTAAACACAPMENPTASRHESAPDAVAGWMVAGASVVASRAPMQSQIVVLHCSGHRSKGHQSR